MENFTALSEQAKQTLQQLSKDLADFKRNNKDRRGTLAENALSSLETTWEAFEVNDQVIQSLNEDGSLDARTYFKSKVFEQTQKIYKEYKELLQKTIQEMKKDPPKEELKDNIEPELTDDDEVVEDNEKKTTKTSEERIDELATQMQQMMKLLTAVTKTSVKTDTKVEKKKTPAEKMQASTSAEADTGPSDKQKNSESYNLYKTVLDIKNETDFPLFPADPTQYRNWRERVQVWEKTLLQGTSDIKKMQKLQTACSQNRTAQSIVNSFDLTQESFRQCLEKLDQQYLIVRNTVGQLLEKLIDLPRVNRDDELLDFVNKVEPTYKNLYNLVKHYCVEDEEDKELRELKIKAKIHDGFINALMMRKLNGATSIHVAGKLTLTYSDIPDPAAVLKVINNKISCQAGLNMSKYPTGKLEGNKGTPNRASSSAVVASHKQKTNNARNNDGKKQSCCYICQVSSHATMFCRKLLNTAVPERFELLKKHRVCCNCLDSEYGKCSCGHPSTKTNCNKCSSKHHRLLHDDNWKPKNMGQDGKVVKNAHVTTQQEKQLGLMVSVIPTASVKLMAENGRVIDARVFIDTGSTNSFITEECATKLGAKRTPTFAAVTTYSGEAGPSITETINVQVQPHFKSTDKLNVEALVTKTLGGDLPSQSVYFERDPDWWDNLELADLDFNHPRPIDMILGVQEYGHIIKPKLIDLKNGLIMQETKLGYIIMGAGYKHRNKFCATTRVEKMDDLARFFEYELEDEEKEDFVENFFMKTVTLDDSGVTVRIPWKVDKALGESRKITLGRVRGMLKRMNPDTIKDYIRQCEDLIKNGYMKPAPQDQPAKNYIANFALQTKSLTTPLRLLFTCDQKTSNGKSINDVQHCGPKLQNDLPNCILRFRYNLVAITADIKKMYLQIKLHPEDAAYQRTFIGRSATGPLEEMELTTVIFGMKSSPYLALRTMILLADKVQEEMPIAAKLLRGSFYVDDLLDSFETIGEAKEALRQIIKTLNMGKFELKKIAASHAEALTEIAREDTLESVTKEFDEEIQVENVKVLGIIWNKKADSLHYKINIEPPQDKITKRVATSVIAKIYDPTGLLAPALLGGKILIQEMWKLSVEAGTIGQKEDWDKELPGNLSEEFKTWQRELPSLEKINIERWMAHSSKNKEEVLVGFSDASTKAYGCVVYLRVVNEEGEVKISILGAKSKVTPLAKNFVPARKEDELTLPRLELMAATMLAKYIKKIQEELPQKEVILFTDSQITLAWIQGEAHRWNTFVANRVKIIKDMTTAEWFYVNTKNNPADLASRVLQPSQLVDTEEAQLWFTGPDFLKETTLRPETAKFTTKLDEKQHQAAAAAVVEDKNEMLKICGNISMWTRTIKVMAYVLRVRSKLRRIRQREKDSNMTRVNWPEMLKAEECREAEEFIIQLYQQQHYSEEIQAIQKKQKIGKGKLQNLNPFLDDKGILRVGGRLGAADYMTHNEKHPIILPKLDIPDKKSEEQTETRSLTRKVIDWGHLSTLHGGELKVLSFLRQKFFIPNARNAIRYVLHRCVLCSVHRARTHKQLMGNLPKDSLLPVPPFYHTTTDYAGPIQIKFGSGRGRRGQPDDEKTIIKNKAWIAVYVCRLTGAYHIELVEDLTARACLSAFKRFVSMRGLPKTVTSDNATTFVKVKKILMEDSKKAPQIAIDAIKNGEEQIRQHFAFKAVQVFTNEDTPQWKFIPPLSPDFGGKHEAAVKQIKNHLTKMIGEQKLPYMVVLTTLKQVEAMLNSRPLCRTEGSAGERDAIITPALPEQDYMIIPTLTDLYVKQQRMVHHFWKLWHMQYLHQLQQLPKWTSTQDEVQVGEIVLLKEDNTPPQVWRKARVIQVFPGKDGHVRVVLTADAQQKEFKRSIRKVVRLPIAPKREEATSSGKEKERKAIMPLIAPPTPKVEETPTLKVDELPTPKVDEPPKRKKGKVNDQQSQPPLRRSARNKAKLSKINFMMVTLLCMTAWVGVAETQNDTSTGLAYFFKRDVMIQVGTHHVEIKTGFEPKKELDMMKAAVDKYDRHCDKAMNRFGKVKCREQVALLKMRHQTMNDEWKEQDAVFSRNKRDFQPGFLFRFFEWAIGSWSDHATPDLHTTKTMGILTHAVQAFQNVSQKLEIKQDYMHIEIRRMGEQIDEEMQKVFTNIDQSRISAQVIGVYNAISRHMTDMEHFYENAAEMITEKDELQQIIDKVNKQVRGATVPEITGQQLLTLMSPTKQIKNGELTVMLQVPVVLEDVYKEYTVMPLPINNTETIPVMEPHDIIVNKKLQQYIETVATHDINETLAITTEVINVFKKVKAANDCAITALMTKQVKCPARKLPKEYDVWRTTPLHNQVVYYSTEKIQLICPTDRTVISSQVGVLTIPKDCYVETTQHKILPSQDDNTIERHGFHVAVESATIDWSENPVPKLDRRIEAMTDTSRTQQDELAEIVKDAVAISQETNSFPWAVVVISISVTIGVLVIGILCVCYWMRRRKTPAGGQPTEEQYEAIPLETIIQSTNPNVNIEEILV